MAIAVLAGAIALYYLGELMSRFLPQWAAILLATLIVWYTVFRLFVMYSVRRQAKVTPIDKGMFGPETLVFSDEGLTAKSEFSETKVKWEQFLRLAEQKSQFLLYIDPLRAYVIPNQSFISSDQQDTWRKMVSKKLEEVSETSLWRDYEK